MESIERAENVQEEFIDLFKRMLKSPLNDAEMETVFRYRKLLLDVRCRSAEIDQEPNYAEFIIQPEHRVVWCPVLKAASSTWIYNFLALKVDNLSTLNDYSRDDLLKAARYERLQNPVTMLEDVLAEGFTSMIIVREPFCRLVDAYHDKILSTRLDSYWKIRCKILGRPYKVSNPIVCLPTFPQFVDYIIAQTSQGMELDDYWAPYHKLCGVCALKWNYIIHFENLDAEGSFFVKKVRMFLLFKTFLAVDQKGSDYL